MERWYYVYANLYDNVFIIRGHAGRKVFDMRLKVDEMGVRQNGMDTTTGSLDPTIYTGASACFVDERLLGVYHAFWRWRHILDTFDTGFADSGENEKGGIRGSLFTASGISDHQCDIKAVSGSHASL